MKPCTLSIQFGPAPVRDAVAWFVGGSQPADWLAEVARWQAPLAGLTLYPVPNSRVDLRPMGVLVTAPQAHGLQSVGFVPQVARAIPFGRIAGNLYLPVVAVLTPAVSEAELSALLGTDFEAYVWHPAVGLIGFEPGEGRRFADLLQSPPHIESDWEQAHPGLPLNQRLRSVSPTEVPSFWSVIEAGRSDIGSETEDLSQLPKSPDEPGSGVLSKLGAGALGLAAYVGLRLINLLPRGTPHDSATNESTAGANTTGGAPAGESWIDRAAQWLGNAIKTAATRFQMASISERERELRRLLDLLANDPDRGLRFALPFGGGAHRGVAPSSGKLAERDVNFDLNRLGGQGPADIWDVAAETRAQLLLEYRRLASRELHLGRHRRAAYIYAELVDDLAAAAGALVAGSHYREAAVLYRDRLKQPLEAAKCLEQGRLWGEALEAYEKLEEFEKAGDLAQKLDQPEDAARLYHCAVERARRRDDSFRAAQLLFSKLQLPDDALRQLQYGWKTSQHKICVVEAYRLWGVLGRHEEARRQLERFAEPECSPVMFRNFIDELAGVANTYPDDLVRSSAADRVRVMAASRLRHATDDESRSLLGAVRWLAPEDRLLTRDCERFLNQPPRRVQAPPPSPRTPQNEAVLIREWRAPGFNRCLAAGASDPWFFLAAYSDEALFVFRGSFTDADRKHFVAWPSAGHSPRTIPSAAVCPRVTSYSWVILEPDSRNMRPVVMHLLGEPLARLPETAFPPDDVSRHPVLVGSPPWATERTLAIADGGNGVFWTLSRSHGALVLDGYNARNAPVASQMIDLPTELQPLIENPPVLPVPLAVRESVFYIGLGDRLVIVGRDGSTETVEMSGSIRGLTCSALHTRRRVAVTFDGCGRVLWDEGPERHGEWFAGSSLMAFPVARFSQFGWLIAAGSEECQVYLTNDRRVRLEATCKWPHSEPIAILDTGAADEFAVCFADCRVLTYRLPKRA